MALYVVNSRVEGSIAGSKWAQMPVVEKAFEGARLNPTKTTYVRTSTGIFFFGFSPPFVLHRAFVLHCGVLMV